MKCLNCEKEFTAKRETAKYCSTNCRVKWHKKHGSKKGVSEIQVQVLYNSMLEMFSKFNKFPIDAGFNSDRNGDVGVSDITQKQLEIKKPNIIRTESYFINRIKEGFFSPEDHADFVNEVNESNLNQKAKQYLILSSRTIQS